MEYNTYIDTLGLQIDAIRASKQREVLSNLKRFVIEDISLCMKYKDFKTNAVDKNSNGIIKREYYIYHNNTTLATIKTGSSKSKKFYINITFAGLKTYNETLDEASKKYLLEICSYLNTRRIKFKISELDICIDVKCKFDNILMVCTKKSANTDYYSIGRKQDYKTTTYIEKIEKDKIKQAVLRSYVYDKTAKENLDMDITRAEVKLQYNYFNKHGLNFKDIEKTLNKYHIMYFEDIATKKTKIKKYNSYKKVYKREIHRLEFDKYKFTFDMEYIKVFIEELFTVISREEQDKIQIENILSTSNKQLRELNQHLQEEFLHSNKSADIDTSQLNFT